MIEDPVSLSRQLGLVYSIIGMGLFLTSLIFRSKAVNKIDKKASKALHTYFKRKPYLILFRALWPLGTTPILLTLLIVTTLYNWRYGLATSLIYLGSMLIEMSLKKSLKRERPFIRLEGVKMLQAKRPNDYSFPSGDALRIWFISLIFPTIYNLGFHPSLLVIFLAIIVSLGRIALGVHYSLDVIAGAGLGILGSGIWTLFCC